MKDFYKEWLENYDEYLKNGTSYLTEFPAIKDEYFEMYENKAWYLASKGEELVYFYHYARPRDRFRARLNQFYHIAFKNVLEDKGNDGGEKNKMKMVPIHVDIPNQISKTMTKLCFPAVPKISINTISNDKNEENETEVLINHILRDNDLENWIQDAGEKLSYSGAIAIKYNIDKSESEYPIMQVYPKEDIEVRRKYGNRIISIIFKDYFNTDKEKYTLYSTYGKGFVDYHLYKNEDLMLGKPKEEVPLSTLDCTKDLKPFKIYKSDGTLYNKILASYLENKSGAKSDYSGCIDEFMTLDEIRSNLVRFLRSSKVKTYIHDNLLVQEENGNLKVPDDYDMDTIIIRDSNPNWTAEDMKRDIVDINNTIQGYKAAFEDILLQVLTGCGLSPATLGYDVSGANSSGLALEIRERTTLHTREDKLQRWKSGLTDMVKKLLIFNDVTLKGDDLVLPKNVEELEKLDVSIIFAEYGRSVSELVDDLIKRMEARLIDIKTAYQMLYPNNTEDEINEMIERAEGLLPENIEPEVPEDDSDLEGKNANEEEDA